MKIETGVKVGEIKTNKKGVSVAYTTAKGEESLDVDADRVDWPGAQYGWFERGSREAEAG
ncbi:MAG: hypothetical protein R3E56_08425 [Burkholderiaceae bacterium]